MAEGRRGRLFTILAILFALVAVEDLLKPLGLEGPQTGLVFLGMRQTGLANAILGPLLGMILLVYAMGIWRMRRYAIGLAWAYAAYVILNLALFSIRNPPPENSGDMIFGIIYAVGGIAMTLGTAIALTRRRAELGPSSPPHHGKE